MATKQRDPYIILGLDTAGEEVRLLWQKFQSGLIQASSGAGKSWLLRRLIEQLYGKIQIIVVDPEGEFSTLREKFSFLLAGPEGDVPCNTRTARALVLKLLEEQVSAILDVSELSLATGAKQDYIKIVAETLIDAPRNLRHPVLFIVDEVHLFATEVGKGEASSTKALIDLCARGRKRGLVPIFATQRMAKVSKDAISELKNYLIGGTMLDSDVKRAIENLGIEGANKAKFSREIRLLDAGNFWALGTAISRIPVLFKVGGVETRHPVMGQHVAPVKASADIQKLLPAFAGLVEDSVDDSMTPEDMRAEIERLRGELATVEAIASDAVESELSAPQFSVDEMRAMLQPEIDAEFEVMAREMVMPLWEYARDLNKTIESVRSQLAGITVPPKLVLPKLNIDAGMVRNARPKTRTQLMQHIAVQQTTSARTHVKIVGNNVQDRILNVLGELNALGIAHPDRKLVCLLSGYKNTASTGFAKAMSQMSASGEITYPSKHTVAAVSPRKIPPPRSLSELHLRLKAQLSGPATKIIDALVPHRTGAVLRVDLCTQTGYLNTASTGFAKAISQMSSIGLLRYPDKNTVALTELLFPRGLR